VSEAAKLDQAPDGQATMRIVGADAVRWAAEQTVRMHAEAPPHTIEPGADVPRCARCLDGRCAMLTWAAAVLNELCAERSATGRAAGPTA